jgi:uncharacterized protein (DUF433 family)
VPSTEVLRAGESWIQKSAEVNGGEACVRNTRVPVWSVVRALQLGASETELLNYFVVPLTPADVEAARAYHEQNRAEIEEQIRLNEEA